MASTSPDAWPIVSLRTTMDELDFLDFEAVEDFDAEDEEAGVVLEDVPVTHTRDRKPTHIFTDKLPYACETQVEFEAQLAAAIGKLVDCVSLRDFDVGFVRWNRYLQSLLSLKYPVPRTWRAQLARFYYDLAVMTSLDARFTETAGSMCIRLLRYALYKCTDAAPNVSWTAATLSYLGGRCTMCWRARSFTRAARHPRAKSATFCWTWPSTRSGSSPRAMHTTCCRLCFRRWMAVTSTR